MSNLSFTLLKRAALALLLLLALAVRLHGVLFEKRGLSHDESISYLCSATTQARYGNEVKFSPARDMTAADIQDFYATPPLDFQRVATDMSTHDIHPPLYFWALHVIHHFFGFHVNEGAVLNFLTGLLTALLLFLLVRHTSRSVGLALLVVTLYSISPAVAGLDLEARQYQFLGLFALASVWLSERISSGHRNVWTYALFIAVNICGFLTHYYYPFILVPGILLQWHRNGLGREWLRYVASLAVSLVGFLLIFPQFFNFIQAYSKGAPGVHRTVLTKIWVLTYFGWAGFFANGPRVLYALAFAVVVLAVGVGISNRVVRGRIGALLRGKSALSFFLWFLLWNITFTAILYLIEIAPAQAVGEQYFAYIWPLFAWFTVLGLRAGLPARVRPWAIGILLLSMLVSLRFTVRDSEYTSNILPDPWYQQMNEADRLVTNEIERANLPRIALGLRPDLPLYLTKDPEAAIADGNAKKTCILLNDNVPIEGTAMKKLLKDPNVKHEVFKHDEYTLICISNP